MNITDYISANKARMMDEWASLLRIPSVSCEQEHKADMRRCVERWKELLLAAGCQHAEVMPAPTAEGNPFVYGEYKPAVSSQQSAVSSQQSAVSGQQSAVSNQQSAVSNQQSAVSSQQSAVSSQQTDVTTVLVYGHYDVMPVAPLELWQSDPWEPTMRNGRLYARGADDDKGQAMIQVKAFEYMVRHIWSDPEQANQYPRCRVKFIFEGEEEIGSPSLAAFIEQHKELLACDVILVSDTSMMAKDIPSLTIGLRGLAYWQIEVSGPNRDLHSGHFGGAVKNPINALTEILAKIMDERGRITIPHFYDDVLPIPQAEREMIRQIPFDEQKYKQAIDVDELFGEEGYVTLERNACRPSFDICGIWGGYTGEGSKTVLPSKAYAKVSCRLVANQNHEKISQLMCEYVSAIAPKGVRVKVTPMHGGEAYLCPMDLPAYKAAEKGFETAFGKRPIAARRGGSIPIIAEFERVLGVKTILMGFGLEQNAIHSPNESMDLEVWEKGIVAVTEFYKAL